MVDSDDLWHSYQSLEAQTLYQFHSYFRKGSLRTWTVLAISHALYTPAGGFALVAPCCLQPVCITARGTATFSPRRLFVQGALPPFTPLPVTNKTSHQAPEGFQQCPWLQSPCAAANHQAAQAAQPGHWLQPELHKGIVHPLPALSVCPSTCNRTRHHLP